MTFTISGIPVHVQKKPIKNMHLYVKPPQGRVSVSAPLRMSDKVIELFVRSKTHWIKEQIRKFEKEPRQAERAYVSGETLYVWGKQHFLQVDENAAQNTLTLAGNQATLCVKAGMDKEKRARFVREWYRGILKTETARLLPKWEEKTGLVCASWHTKAMVTRWGSCNPRARRIWLNIQLAKKPMPCLEYVILHELLHFIERGHGNTFTALLDAHMPMWRDIKKTLNAAPLAHYGEVA